jgi:AraC-like DNA-binding protein
VPKSSATAERCSTAAVASASTRSHDHQGGGAARDGRERDSQSSRTSVADTMSAVGALSPTAARVLEGDTLNTHGTSAGLPHALIDDARLSAEAVRLYALLHRLLVWERQPVTVEELQARWPVTVSQRTLEYAFRDAFGLTPIGYLRLHRFHRARNCLLAARPERESVTNIAYRAGFFELGRFSGTYRSLFGERPSDTLRRCSPAGQGLPPSLQRIQSLGQF